MIQIYSPIADSGGLAGATNQVGRKTPALWSGYAPLAARCQSGADLGKCRLAASPNVNGHADHLGPRGLKCLLVPHVLHEPEQSCFMLRNN